MPSLPLSLSLLPLTLAAAPGGAPPDAPTVLHVAATARPGGDGSSWTTAFADLQVALGAASALPPPVEVWVATGTYRPAPPDGPRSAHFRLRPGVALYGGFAGDETERGQRAPDLWPTVLSGDLAGDDTPQFGSRGDNSLNVLIASGPLGPEARLDGFLVRGGFCDQAQGGWNGGGLRLQAPAVPTIVHCRFEDNHAEGFGGALSVSENGAAGEQFLAPLRLSHCTFAHNRAFGAGGAAAVTARGDVGFSDCSFHDNWVQGPTGPGLRQGGALFLSNTDLPGLRLERCELRANRAGLGGALAAYSSALSLRDCALLDNQASSDGGALDAITVELEITGCTIAGNLSPAGGAAVQGLLAITTVRHSVVHGNAGVSFDLEQQFSAVSIEQSLVAGGWPGPGNFDAPPQFVDAAGGDYRLSAASPALDLGPPAAAGPSFDVDGLPRGVDGLGTGEPRADLGAHEYQGGAAGAALFASATTLSVTRGGTQFLELTAEPSGDLALGLLLGSSSGIAPGSVLGPSLLPLVADEYLGLSLALASSGPFVGTFGPLDAAGRLSAAIQVPAGTPQLAGLLLHHAGLILDPASPLLVVGTSNPVPLRLEL
jgi:hypothetical protein